MSLRLRLAAAFAAVVALTGVVVAIAAPAIVGGGFARLENDWVSPGGGGPGSGLAGGASPGTGVGLGTHYQQIQTDTTVAIVAVALLAAVVATAIGFLIAVYITRPMRRLEEAAAAVAGGDLGHRSGVGSRRDEIGALGRSFDTMAAELQAAEESRRRFFQDAAHELKTPLAVIEATSSAVLEGVYEHDREHLETILEQSQILSRIVSDLRTISLAESGDLPLRSEPVDISELVRGVVRAHAARAERAGLTLASDAPEGAIVRGDRERLVQVVGALLDNAIRHTPNGGIAVTVAAVPGFVRVDVADTGPGIPAAALDHVFDRFYQADEARDRSSGTSGLGLSIVKALVEAHRGTVTVANLPAGGARFRVEIPAA